MKYVEVHFFKANGKYYTTETVALRPALAGYEITSFERDLIDYLIDKETGRMRLCGMFAVTVTTPWGFPAFVALPRMTADLLDDTDAMLAEVREQVLAELGPMVEGIAERLRETAAGLRAWQRNGQGAVASIHPMHAANRLEQIADQISKRNSEGEQSK